MKTLMRILGGLAVLVLLLVVVAFFLPDNYHVERSIVINAPVDKIHPQLADLRAWKNWTVWNERDPGMKVSYSDTVGVVGSWSSWESAKEGTGKATLAEVDANRVVYDLEFVDFESKMTGRFDLKPEGQQVRVTWSTEGALGNNPIWRWMGLCMDGMLGKDFEAGLAKLKKVTET